MVETFPSERGTDPHLIITPSYIDDDTGAVYVHKDLVQVIAPFETESHIGPIEADEAFADVESWAWYVKQHGTLGPTNTTLLTYNAAGLRAVLDFHGSEAGRRQHIARQPFMKSAEFLAWEAFANGSARRQKDAIEQLETLGEDIMQPTETELMAILRNLRANVNSTAQVELKPDGTQSISFSQTQTVQGRSSEIDLPGTFSIGIPVLRGDVEKSTLLVRVRSTMDDSAHLALRFSLINAERTLERNYGERVTAAKALLGDGYTILRAA